MYAELPSVFSSGHILLRVNGTFDQNFGVGLNHVPELRYTIRYVDDITFKEMLQIVDTSGILPVNYKDRFIRPKHLITGKIQFIYATIYTFLPFAFIFIN